MLFGADCMPSIVPPGQWVGLILPTAVGTCHHLSLQYQRAFARFPVEDRADQAVRVLRGP